MAFRVVPDELRTHAKHLDALTDRLNTAVDAAKTVVMDDSAYGLLCAFLPPIINKTTQDDATEALHSAVEGMTSTADNVKTAAQSYDDTDEANAEPFKKGIADDVGADGSAVQAKLRPQQAVHRTMAGETTAQQPDGTVNETLQRIGSLPNEQAQPRFMEKGVAPQSTEGVPASEHLVERLPEGTEQ